MGLESNQGFIDVRSLLITVSPCKSDCALVKLPPSSLKCRFPLTLYQCHKVYMLYGNENSRRCAAQLCSEITSNSLAMRAHEPLRASPNFAMPLPRNFGCPLSTGYKIELLT
jgi:hypothetical protein